MLHLAPTDLDIVFSHVLPSISPYTFMTRSLFVCLFLLLYVMDGEWFFSFLFSFSAIVVCWF